MRATRAYLAGFGTSGSLLAGAALMFVLASAFVGFQGWPQVAGQSNPVSVSIPRSDVGTGSRAARVLSAAVSVPVAHHGGAGAAGGAGARTHSAHGRVGTAAGRQGGQPLTHHLASGHTPAGSTTGTTPGSAPTTCSSGCSHSGGGGGGGGGGVLSRVKQTVSSTSSSAGATAGTTVGNVVTTVKKLVRPVKKLTGTAGTTVGNVVSTTKSVVGGLP